MADSWRDQLARQYQDQRAGIRRQAQTQRQAVADAANKARTNLKGQLSSLEREAEVAINQIRKAEALEQRKRDLPLTKPKDIQAKARIADLNRQRNVIQTAIAKAKEDIANAESEDLDAVMAAESSAMAELDRARRRAEREGAKAEAEYNKALADIQANYVEVKGGYINKTDYEGLSANDQVLVRRLGVDKFNELKETKLERAEANFQSTHTRLNIKDAAGNPLYVLTSEYDALTPQQKREVKNTGQYTVELSARKQFDLAVKDGTIPATSIFVGESKDGGFEYKPGPAKPPVTITVSGRVVSPPPVTITSSGVVTSKGKATPPPAPPGIWQGIVSTIGDYLYRQYVAKDTRTQAELKAEYDAFMASSVIAQAIHGQTVMRDPKTGKYYPIARIEGPALGVGGAANIAKGVLAVAGGYGLYEALPALKGIDIRDLHISNETRDKIIKNVTQAVGTFRDTMGRVPGTIDAIVTDAEGRFASTIVNLGNLDLPGFGQVDIDTSLPGVKPPVVDTALTPFPGVAVKPMTIPPLTGKREVVIYLPTPKKTLEDVIGTAHAYFLASAAVATAENNLKTQTKTIPINWNKILDDAHKAKTAATVERIFTEVNNILKKADAPNTVVNNYRRAYEAYLAKWKILSDASKAYVASLNMQPIVGVSTKEAVSAAASLYLAKQVAMQSLTQSLSKGMTATQSATQALTDTLTATQMLTTPQVSAQTLAQTAVQTAVQTLTATQTMTKTQAQTATQTLTKTALQTKTATQAKTAARTAAKTATQTLTRAAALRIPAPPTVTLPDGTEHTLTEKEFKGAVGWKMGWCYKMIFPPYGKNNIVNSRKPIPGIKYYKGIGSAYKSIVRLGGKLPKTIERDMGIMDITITTPKSGKPQIAFTRDILQRTTRTRGKRKPKSKRGGRRYNTTPSLGTVRL